MAVITTGDNGLEKKVNTVPAGGGQLLLTGYGVNYDKIYLITSVFAGISGGNLAVKGEIPETTVIAGLLWDNTPMVIPGEIVFYPEEKAISSSRWRYYDEAGLEWTGEEATGNGWWLEKDDEKRTAIGTVEWHGESGWTADKLDISELIESNHTAVMELDKNGRKVILRSEEFITGEKKAIIRWELPLLLITGDGMVMMVVKMTGRKTNKVEVTETRNYFSETEKLMLEGKFGKNGGDKSSQGQKYKKKRKRRR